MMGMKHKIMKLKRVQVISTLYYNLFCKKIIKSSSKKIVH